MELMGHLLSTAYSLMQSGLNCNDLMGWMRENAAKLCLPDTIRNLLDFKSEMKYARIFSHFTNGAGMSFPIDRVLRQSGWSPESVCQFPKHYVPSIVDKQSDFGKFIRMNLHMFQKDVELWGLCTLVHLYQDAATDKVYQKLFKFGETETGEVIIHGTFRAKDMKVTCPTGKIVDGVLYRENVSKSNILYNAFVLKKITDIYAISLEEILEACIKSFEEFYDKKMAKSAINFLKASNVFTTCNKVEIARTLIESGFCFTLEELTKIHTLLFNEAVAACNCL